MPRVSEHMSFLHWLLALHSMPAPHCLTALVGSHDTIFALVSSSWACRVEQKLTHLPMLLHLSVPLEQAQRSTGSAIEQTVPGALQSVLL
jgi:hypothetical protein